ncbi:hypothetical protein [Tissierella praeacuta]|uniref:hypothetical protein n=1 Tax=Tissierella praeacuta TaxID=43131 RepID=UPI0028AC7934|nr:hypothetical protein [Tissierella praeacuta]
MNIKEIFKENGYEIVTEVGMKYFRLKFTEEKLEEMMKKKDLYDYDITGSFNVEISEVGFNGYGGLYIVLDCLGDEHFEKSECFDVIEY